MSVSLVHPHARRAVSAARLIDKCTLFKTNLSLLTAPYSVKSSVPVEVFRAFVSALEDGAVEITKANVAGLSLLCTEFGFGALGTRLSDFGSSASLPLASVDAEARAQIAAREERVLTRDRETAVLQAELVRLSAAVEALRASADRREAQRRADGAAIATSVDGLRADVLTLKAAASHSAAGEPPPSLSAVRASIGRSEGLLGARIDSVRDQIAADVARVSASIDALRAEVLALKAAPSPLAPRSAKEMKELEKQARQRREQEEKQRKKAEAEEKKNQKKAAAQEKKDRKKAAALAKKEKKPQPPHGSSSGPAHSDSHDADFDDSELSFGYKVPAPTLTELTYDYTISDEGRPILDVITDPA
jgi:peptidoglycan hydrolase CwlO-like protein